MRQLAPAAGVQLMPRPRVWPVYLIALPILVIASLVVESGVIEVVNSFHVPGTPPVPTWLGVAVDLVPAFLTGFAIVFLLGTAVMRRRPDASPLPHAIRAAPFYLLAAVLGAYVAYSHNSPGWGLVGQIFVWPLVLCLGGILGDAAAGRASRSVPERAGTKSPDGL